MMKKSNKNQKIIKISNKNQKIIKNKVGGRARAGAVGAWGRAGPGLAVGAMGPLVFDYFLIFI